MDRQRLGLITRQDRHDPPRLQILGEQPHRRQRNAEPAQDHFPNRLRIVALGIALDAHAVALPVLFVVPEVLAAQQIELQAVVLAQLFRGLRFAPARQVRGAGDGDPLGIADAPGDQVAVAQFANAQADIQAFLDQVLVLVVELQVDLQLRIAGEEVRQSAGDLQTTETHRGADAQAAGDLFPARLKTVFGIVHGSEDLSALCVVALPLIGQ